MRSRSNSARAGHRGAVLFQRQKRRPRMSELSPIGTGQCSFRLDHAPVPAVDLAPDLHSAPRGDVPKSEECSLPLGWLSFGPPSAILLWPGS
jgi:hypothetical protein